ncbi:MAG: type II 3-dehydroquinate dehydratase [Candidatus Marinimicrobia bacterium]|jgi:3-dehydroquinate dehydratase-2|nr:type II 3-dehydroquinate dehydratase [Candidatus Neomarinimicrobiota bacterium]MBT3936805.1 type II 3-dehydroquinate dehydratase [Candidatus Neomarinimicrobiota bacterium]MBT3962000.1 type II 3-dehydroquinate dehydratase [Candidatus Neomarinimicrobiota bacterium]MBT4383690.1 type II 3-dehydroquinate dehydratase [Candidatus Neomarinimicrobiota bacterium]MBT4637165.1 type II 3-dehydroquinate dehydratase [Candidatus Neomarinimicrobiota bacterium]
MKFLIINGPNLNLLGKREPEIYGSDSLAEIESWVKDSLENNDHQIEWFQSNHEGEIIDIIHKAINHVDGIVINPGAYTHYSYAIRDAISSAAIPTIEVHLSDINNRENFRQISVIKDVCVRQILGLRKTGYLKALKLLINLNKTD